MLGALRHIVDDLDRGVAFYSRHLGFTLDRQYGPAMAILRREDLELWHAGPTASASRPMPDGARPVPGGWARIVVAVDNLDELVARLRANSVAMRSEIISGPGGRQVLCLDPAGNVVELFEPT